MITDDMLRAAYAPIHLRDLRTLQAEAKLSPAGQKRLTVLREYQKHGVVPVQFRAPVIPPPPPTPGPGSVFYSAASEWSGLGRAGNPPMLILGNPKGKERREFARYLRETLIPDLKAAGREMTAQDFLAGLAFLAGRRVAGGFTRSEYINYLEQTLIPDLIDAGWDQTARDFQTLSEMLGGVPMLLNPSRRSALMREARESMAFARSDVKAGHKGAAKYWEGRAAGLSQAALQNPSVRVVPWSANVWCIERWNGKTWTCACPRHGHYRSMREAEEVATREFGAPPVLWGPPYGAHPVKRNPGGELECQYCGSGELVYMGQIGPSHAYRCRRCGMDLVVDIPPNPEYLARYISPSSEVREEVIKARGTKGALRKAERRAAKLPPQFTAPHSSVEVAPIGGPNPFLGTQVNPTSFGRYHRVAADALLRRFLREEWSPDFLNYFSDRAREVLAKRAGTKAALGLLRNFLKSEWSPDYLNVFADQIRAINPETQGRYIRERFRAPIPGAKYGTITTGKHRIVRMRRPGGPWQTQAMLHPMGERFRLMRELRAGKRGKLAIGTRGREVVLGRPPLRKVAMNPGRGCNGRRCNHNGVPGYIWHDPRFQAELRAYKKRHGTGPVEIRGIKVPKGYPKYMSVYGRAPHAVYDAPPHSNKGKRIHHFGGRGKTQPWLVSSVERGPKFLAYVGGTFRARPDWLYD